MDNKKLSNSLRFLGSTALTGADRQQDDYYATDPKAAELLLELEPFTNIWEPACGGGHLAKVFAEHKVLGKATDLVDRGYGDTLDFLSSFEPWDGDIITNPPFKIASEFVTHSLKIIPDGRKVAMFLPIRYLEGRARKEIFAEFPPKTVYVSASRIVCAKNADFEHIKSSPTAYAWIVWEKGFDGITQLKWFN